MSTSLWSWNSEVGLLSDIREPAKLRETLRSMAWGDEKEDVLPPPAHSSARLQESREWWCTLSGTEQTFWPLRQFWRRVGEGMGKTVESEEEERPHQKPQTALI
ncbi:hypothetical protein B0H10DRAFT_1945239 [Mycena sp. CBHHK59/15]|nr:hypothetical protein B0H10DRAFT_1945239 [Mycena sp. CBHHK59/15]